MQFSLKRLLEGVLIFGVLFGVYCAVIRSLSSGIVEASIPVVLGPMVFFHLVLLYHFWPLPLGLMIGYVFKGMSGGGLRLGCIVSVLIWLVYFLILMFLAYWLPADGLRELGFPYG